VLHPTLATARKAFLFSLIKLGVQLSQLVVEKNKLASQSTISQ
jgi:hypothetical protein